ncbi:hypothetical protein [Azovibrio restrictus]|nr:hypothetical protein [Azovibrio restrictus]
MKIRIRPQGIEASGELRQHIEGYGLPFIGGEGGLVTLELRTRHLAS